MSYASHCTNPINHNLPWFLELAFLPETTAVRKSRLSVSRFIEFAENIEVAL